MADRLIALKFFKTSSNLGSGLSEKAEIDYQELFVTILLKFIDVIEAALIIIAGIFAVKIVKRYLGKIEATHERQQTALNLLEKISSGFLLVVTFTLALKVIGLDLTLILSVITLGLSFGLRDVIKNYVAGLLILFKAPFEIGDVIKIRAFTGKVERIEFQAVSIRTFDRKEVTIHNSDLLTQPITNFSKTQQIRIEIMVSLGYGTNVEQALSIFDRILQNNPLVLKSPRYSIVFKNFAQQGVQVLVRFWVQKPSNVLRIRSDLALQISEAFDEATVFAPYAREAGLESSYGMTEARRERLKMFYGQPMLATVATQTATQVAAATQPAEEYVDADEPE